MNISKFDDSKEKIIELVTNEVIKQLKSNAVHVCGNKKAVLVLGSDETISCLCSGEYEYFGIESYICDEDIEKYCFVFINKISNAQLCDIALGREDTPFTRAVQKALFSGKKVYMHASALSHRKYKETAPKDLYIKLEKYVQQLVDYGVIITQDIRVIDSGSGCCENEHCDSCEKVITYSIAQNICKKGKNQVTFANGTIVTPLAKDLFFAEKIDFKII